MDTLIEGLVDRIAKLLPFNSRTTTNNMGDLRQTATSLIKLSNYQLDAVVNGLLHVNTSLEKNYQNVMSSPETLALSVGNNLLPGGGSATGDNSTNQNISNQTTGAFGSSSSLGSNNGVVGNTNNTTSTSNTSNTSTVGSFLIPNNGPTGQSRLNLFGNITGGANQNNNNNAAGGGGGSQIPPETLHALEEEVSERFIRSKIIIFQLFLKTLSAAIKYERLDLRFDDDHLLMIEADSSNVDANSGGNNPLDANTSASDYNDTPNNNNESATNSSSESTAVDDNGTTSEEELAPPAGFNESEITKLGNDYSETLLTQIIDTLFNIKSSNTSGGNVNTANSNTTDESIRTKGPYQYLKHLAARVLFKLSVVNFEVVFVRVEEFFKKMKSDEVDDRIYQMIEYINFDSAKLTRLISLLNEVQAKLKAKAFVAIAGPLRQAIWNWITNYPHQFIRNCKNKTELPGGPQKLFNVIAERKLKKQAPFIWPLQIMILLLCPEVFANTIMAVKQGDKPKPSEKKEYKFLENILKALKEKNTKRDVNSDTAVVCFVDFYKASTYLKSRDLTAFRFLNSEVQNALHERLMNSDNPVRKNGTDDVDVKLMVDFFVSAYRINQRHVTSYIFPHCFKTKNTVFKLALAKSMLKLARKNSTSLKWHPTLAHSYKHIAKFVRNMFQELLQQESLLYNKRGQSVTQPSGSSSGSTTPPSTETLLACLAVFFAEPRLVLENTSDNISGHINEILYFFVGLVNCLEGVSNYQVQAQAYKLLQKLFQPHYIMQWCPQDIATGFIDLSSSVISRLCFILFQDKESQGQNVTTILELVKDVCTASNKFLSLHKDKITDQNLASRKRTQMWESAESTLLVLLCSTDPDIWTTAAGVFGDLCDMIDILENKETHNGIAQNYQLYRKISKLDELGKTRNHQQKSIRRLLRRVELQTKANLAAFIEMYSRWKDFTKTLEEGSIRNKELIDDARLVEHTRLKNLWKNYTAFLCSMGGVCLQSSETLLNPSNNPVSIKEQNQGGTTMDDSTNDGSLSARGVRGATTLKKEKKDFSMKDDLIRNLMRLVVSDVPLIRDNVAQTIGTELAPSLYGVLFQSLHSYVSGCFEEGASIVRISSSSTLFVEKAIHIVRSVLEQAQENSEDLAMAKFETLILSFIRYCSQLVLNKDYNVIKCKLCILIDIMMKRKEYITFNNEIMFRFEALRHITEWTSEFVNKTAASSTTSVVELDFPNLDALCMKAISAVLKDLNFTKVRDKQSAGNSEKNDDMNKREFIKHFSFLSRYLTRSKVDKDAHPQLREYTILSLGNLLESNINYGLEQFMKMTYIEDQETRSAFLSVLTRVMKQGIQLEEEQNTESVKKYDKLLNLFIQDPNLDLVFLMVSSVSVNEMDDLCKALIRLFAERGRALELLKKSIDKEVDATSSSSTLFRANSSASKMLTAYCNSVGFKYIVDTLSELVKKVVSDPGNFEVDDTKLKPTESIEKNATLLAATAQAFLEHVFTSVDELPLPIRFLCNYLSESVNNKFPPVKEDEERHSSKHVVVGGLLFLRLLNPAIVSPKTAGLVDQSPSSEASRCLLLISKLLQNVANGIKFERKQNSSDAKSFNKEAFMVKMDPFVAKNFDRARQFFDSVSSKCPDDFKEAEFIMEDEVREENFLCVHRFLFNNMEKMQQRLVQLQRSGQQSTQNKVDNRKTVGDEDLSIISPVTDPKKLAEFIERLQVIMTELGKPPEKDVKKATMASASEEYSTPHLIQLISDNKDKDLTQIEERKIFYRSGTSKEARPVFYFITQSLGSHFVESSGDKEDDKVMYHVFKTLMNFWTKPYEVVVDVTGLREETGLQAGHIVNFFKTLPTGARKNCARVIIFNPNSYLKTHLSQKFSYVKRKAIKKKVSFCISVRELEEHIERKNIDLPQSTLDYERDVESTFSSAFILSQRGEKKDAVVKVSKKYLCVITSDNILNHDTKRIDFIELLSISHATISTSAGNTEHVSVEYGSNNKLMVKAEKNDLLLMNIRNSIFRQKSEATLDDRVGRERAEGIRQQDIPGSLLNMCFLNLESKFPRTRSEAYNLLAALAEQFEFPVTLLETDIICVPHNTGDLVVALSEQVSKAKPLLTTQFLREALRGFNKVSLPYKYLVLKYMKPWIKNLSMIYAQANDAKQTPVQQMNTESLKGGNYEMSIVGGSMMSSFEAQVQIDRTTEWFPDLVKSTIDFQDIYPAVLSEIWGELSKDGALVDIAMRCIISAAHEAGPKMSKKVDILNDLVVTLASGGHAPAVVKMIVDQLLDVMDNEIQEVVEPLEEHPGWAKVIIYCRFLLMLSFQNRISVLDNFPTLFYIISMMIGRGSMFLRATIRGFAINVVHSLSTSLDFTNEHKKIMQQHLTTLISDKFQFMFMGTDAARDMDPFVSFENDGTTPAKKEKPFKISPINMWDLETLAHYFYEVTKTCYLVDPEIQKRWHKELTQMCHNKALKINPVFLPRLLTMYGVLIKPGEETQETLPFVVERLIDSFSTTTTTTSDNHHGNSPTFRTDYKIATLLCLGQYSYKLSPDEPILKQVFAIPIVLLALSDESLFPAVVHLFDCVLNAVGASPQFQKCISIEEYFNTYCRVSGSLVDNLITKVEVSIGVSFRTHFSFALSCLLMRGLTNPQTKSTTANICANLITLSARLQHNRMLMLGEEEDLGLSSIDQPHLPSTSQSDLSTASSPLSLEGSSLPSTPKNVSESTIKFYYSILGFIALLIPSDFEKLCQILGGKVFFNDKTFLSSSFAPLLFTRFLITVVQHVDMDTERIAIYSALQEAFHKLSSVFVPVYPDVLPHMINVYNKANITRIAEVSLTLIDIIMQQTEEKSFKPKVPVNYDDSLSKVGFGGLGKLGSFKIATDKIKHDVALLLVDYLKDISKK